jgi:hypothetical protein
MGKSHWSLEKYQVAHFQMTNDHFRHVPDLFFISVLDRIAIDLKNLCDLCAYVVHKALYLQL